MLINILTSSFPFKFWGDCSIHILVCQTKNSMMTEFLQAMNFASFSIKKVPISAYMHYALFLYIPFIQHIFKKLFTLSTGFSTGTIHANPLSKFAEFSKTPCFLNISSIKLSYFLAVTNRLFNICMNNAKSFKKCRSPKGLLHFFTPFRLKWTLWHTRSGSYPPHFRLSIHSMPEHRS